MDHEIVVFGSDDSDEPKEKKGYGRDCFQIRSLKGVDEALSLNILWRRTFYLARPDTVGPPARFGFLLTPTSAWATKGE